MSFRTEDALNKHLKMCNETGRRTFHNNDYLKLDKFRCKNRVPFAMYYDFKCKKKRWETPTYCLWVIYKK